MGTCERTELGGEADGVFLAGHSSGAVHATGYLLDRGFHPADGVGVRSGLLFSAGYKMEAAGMSANRQAYFGTDEAQYRDRSPLTHVGESDLPLLIVAVEHDPLHMAARAFELAHAVTLRGGRTPRLLWLAGHNHISYIYCLGTEQAEFADAVMDFIGAH